MLIPTTDGSHPLTVKTGSVGESFVPQDHPGDFRAAEPNGASCRRHAISLGARAVEGLRGLRGLLG
jgi:hypothetical protein